MSKVGHCDDKTLFVIKCVHEMQEVRVMELIASFTRGDEKSEEFKLGHLNISPVEFAALFEFLSYCKNLDKLVIREFYMEHFAFRELAKLLIRNNDINCKLTQLGINYNELTDEGVKYLTDALKSGNCKLTHLAIRGNKLTNQGAKYLSDALKNGNCKLTHLLT